MASFISGLEKSKKPVNKTRFQGLAKISENVEVTANLTHEEWQEENAKLEKEIEKNNKLIEQQTIRNADQTHFFEIKEQAKKHNAELLKENEALLAKRKISANKQEKMFGEAIRSKQVILQNLQLQMDKVGVLLNENLGKLKLIEEDIVMRQIFFKADRQMLTEHLRQEQQKRDSLKEIVTKLRERHSNRTPPEDQIKRERTNIIDLALSHKTAIKKQDEVNTNLQKRITELAKTAKELNARLKMIIHSRKA